MSDLLTLTITTKNHHLTPQMFTEKILDFFPTTTPWTFTEALDESVATAGKNRQSEHADFQASVAG